LSTEPISAGQCYKTAVRSTIAAVLTAGILAATPAGAAAWQPLGELGPPTADPNFTVQSKRPVAIAPSGRSVFAWARDDKTVLVRGVKPGGELDWLRTATTNGHDGVVGIDRNGTATVAWITWESDFVQTRTIGPAGEMGPVKTLTSPNTVPAALELEVAPSGYALFSWLTVPDAFGADPREEAIRARSRSAGGVFSPVQDIAFKRPPGNGQGLWGNMALAPSGDAVFAWFRNGSQRSIRSRTRSADGTLGPVRKLAVQDGGPSGYLGYPDVAVDVDRNGVPTVAWLRSRDPGCCTGVVAKVGNGPVTTISTKVESVFYPVVAIDRDGDALFAWRSTSGIHARGRSAGGALGPVQTIESDANQDLSLAVDRTGGAVFVWMRILEPAGIASPPVVEPRARTRSAAGVLGPSTALDGEIEDYPAIGVAMNRAGAAAAMWDAGGAERGALGP
jgi:hypothetical protein